MFMPQDSAFRHLLYEKCGLAAAGTGSRCSVAVSFSTMLTVLERKHDGELT